MGFLSRVVWGFKTTVNKNKHGHGDKVQKHRVGCVLHPKEADASERPG